MTYTLYFCPQTRAFHGLWMMEEADVPYELEVVNIRDPKASAAHRARAPMGKVPALMADGELVFESTAICAFMADAEPQAGLAPKVGEKGRGEYLRWLFFCAAAIEPAFIDRAFKRETPAATAGWGSAESVLRTLRWGLEGKEYLVGGRFTAADLMIGSTIHFLTGFGIMEREPIFDAYVARLTERPAFKRASEIEAEQAKALYGDPA